MGLIRTVVQTHHISRKCPLYSSASTKCGFQLHNPHINPYQALIRICNYLGALPASSWTPVGQTPASLRQRSCRRLWSAASHWHQIRIKLLNRGSWWTWLDCALLSVDPPNHGSSSTLSIGFIIAFSNFIIVVINIANNIVIITISR